MSCSRLTSRSQIGSRSSRTSLGAPPSEHASSHTTHQMTGMLSKCMHSRYRVRHPNPVGIHTTELARILRMAYQIYGLQLRWLVYGSCALQYGWLPAVCQCENLLQPEQGSCSSTGTIIPRLQASAALLGSSGT